MTETANPGKSGEICNCDGWPKSSTTFAFELNFLQVLLAIGSICIEFLLTFKLSVGKDANPVEHTWGVVICFFGWQEYRWTSVQFSSWLHFFLSAGAAGDIFWSKEVGMCMRSFSWNSNVQAD